VGLRGVGRSWAGEGSGCLGLFGLGQVKHCWSERIGAEVQRDLEGPGRGWDWGWGPCSAVVPAQVLAEKRSLGSRDGPPHLVVLVPLHSRAAAHDTLRLLQSQDSAVIRVDEGRESGFALLCPRLKQRWRFVAAQAGEVMLLVWFLALCPWQPQ